MTLVLGPVEAALDGDFGELDPGLEGALRTVRSNALRQLRLLNQLLELARLDAGNARLELSMLDLEVVLAGAVRTFATLAESRQVDLRLDAEPVPPVWADRDRFEQVISNLLSNALKFTPRRGRVEVRLRVRDAASAPARVVVEVADTGPGIPAEALGRVFERYYRAPSARGSPGTGVGLALARELVRLHHGTIEAESAAGEGASFRVELSTGRRHFGSRGWSLAERPRGLVSAETTLEASVAELSGEAVPPEPPEPAPAEEVASEDDRPLLLLVDDDAELRRHLRVTLGSGYSYAEAEDGAAALELLEEIEPEIVVSDVVMPGIDGFELCRRLRERPETDHLTIVLLTARAELKDRLAGLSHGADDYLAKPFLRRELVTRIANLVERRRRLRERWLRPGAAFAEAVEGTPPERLFLRRTLAAIEERLADPELSVPQLARALALSTRSLQRKLKAITGSGPLELLRTLRLERAAALLERGGVNVSEAAHRVGFADPGTFSRAFRSHFGHPPSEHGGG